MLCACIVGKFLRFCCGHCRNHVSVLCVLALWENFHDFVVAIAEHVSCAVCMHCGKISAILLRPLPESCECAMCACIVGKFPRFHCGRCRACVVLCACIVGNFPQFRCGRCHCLCRLLLGFAYMSRQWVCWFDSLPV